MTTITTAYTKFLTVPPATEKSQVRVLLWPGIRRSGGAGRGSAVARGNVLFRVMLDGLAPVGV